MGRLHGTGISQKTCQINLIFKAFGKKSAGSFIDSPLKISLAAWMLDIRAEYKLVVEKRF